MSTMEVLVKSVGAEARFDGMVIETGSEGNPSPFQLFLVSLSNCAAQTAAGYCRKHGLPFEGMKFLLDVVRDPETRMATEINMQIVLPAGFPENRKTALIKAAEACFVKRHLFDQPSFSTTIAE